MLLLLFSLAACTDKDPGPVDSDPGQDFEDGDGDGWIDEEDCAPGNADIFPGALERCDGVDNDCDEGVDEGVTDTWHADDDGDGFGDPQDTVEACEQPEGYSVVGTDCDDGAAATYPGAPEACDEADNDCDGGVDEGSLSTFYADYDRDGYGDPGAPVEACALPAGAVADDSDCDDGDAGVFPGAAETCDSADQDCDGRVDEGATDVREYYRDVDEDGFGDLYNSTIDCSAPLGYVDDNTDCDDRDADAFPGGVEACDGDDEDCDGQVDEGEALYAQPWYQDSDGDGYGDVSTELLRCAAPGGYVGDDTDCDDSDAAVNPRAVEVCNNVDDDCDGDVDDEDSSLDSSTASWWYDDGDGDGYGDASAAVLACVSPSGQVSDDTDCDDGDSGVNPGAAETCDGVDEDCDGDIDDGVLGTGGACPAIDCAEVLADDPSAADGSYYLDVGGSVSTWTCDMSTDGGGWTELIDSHPVYGTGSDLTAYNSEGFTWDEVLFAYDSGSAYAHCTYPNDISACLNLGFQFATNNWGVPARFASTICGLSTLDYSSATRFPGGYDFIVARSASTDTIRLSTLEGYTNCTTNDNYGTAYVDIRVRR
ncbi:MAG: hypothetical protein H6741_22810 [Alphaproteobacteria bacterium]|nr:hypothetical protein [Alphaproteobacteria bacterium]